MRAMEIYSKIQKEMLLHKIVRFHKISKNKTSFITKENFPLQVSITSCLPINHKFSGPHKHIPCEKKINLVNEAFIVIKGNLKVVMYDINNLIISEVILSKGDMYIYLGGGHGFEIMSDNTVFYEIKNGPYMGQQKDKIHL